MSGAVEKLIAAEVGGQFVVEQGAVTLSTTLGTVLRNDPERAALLVVNTGATIARLTWERPGGASVSIPIAANGGSLSLNWRDDLVLPTYELLGDVGVGTTTLLTLSVRRVNA